MSLLFLRRASFFLAIVASSTISLLKVARADDPAPVKPSCCIGIYSNDDPALFTDANGWLNAQKQCTIKQLYSTQDVDLGLMQETEADCGKLYVYHAKHGPACDSIFTAVNVCAKTYQNCDIDFTSVSCSSFSNKYFADNYIASLKLSEASLGRKISITGEQTNSFRGRPECSVTLTYELQDRSLSCSVGACVPAGTTCSPVDAMVNCSVQGGVANQTCCPLVAQMDGGPYVDMADAFQLGYFSPINTSCPNADRACYLKYDSTTKQFSPPAENFIYPAEACPGTLEGLSAATPYSLVDKCSGAKCEFKCREGWELSSAGYPFDHPGLTCVPKYRCLGLLPEEATLNHMRLCAGYGQKLTYDQNTALVEPYQCPSNRSHCSVICDAGYHKEGPTCVLDYACSGALPAYSQLCADSHGISDAVGLRSPEKRTGVAACSDQKKCEYRCLSEGGYIPTADGLSCFQPKCTGTAPAHALLCSDSQDINDDKMLTANVPISLVGTCTDQKKCEYECMIGNILSPDGKSCVPAVCTGLIPSYSALCLNSNGTRDDVTLPANTPWLLTNSCSDERKCERTCLPGYIPTADGQNCFKPKCLGPVPSRAVLCSGDDLQLSGDTQRALKGSCTDSYKCEYVCNSSSYLEYVTNSCQPRPKTSANCVFDPNSGTETCYGVPGNTGSSGNRCLFGCYDRTTSDGCMTDDTQCACPRRCWYLSDPKSSDYSCKPGCT